MHLRGFMQQQPDIGTLEYRVKSIEVNVQQLQQELRSYVPTNVNDLQLQSIRSTVERIENDVKDLNTQLSNQIKQQDQLQIRILKYFVITVISILVALLISYLTHIIQ